MENPKVIDKVKKLLSLGTNEGASEGERENAMRMAHALLTKHNLTTMDLVDKSDRIKESFPVWSDKYQIQLAAACADLFFCIIYTQKGGVKDKDAVFIGRKDNVITAIHMTQYLIKSVNSEASRLKMGNSFKNGAANQIRARVQEIINKPVMEETSDCTSLMVISLYKSEKESNDVFLQNEGVKLSKAITKKTKVNAEFIQGQIFGKAINLNLQITQ